MITKENIRLHRITSLAVLLSLLVNMAIAKPAQAEADDERNTPTAALVEGKPVATSTDENPNESVDSQIRGTETILEFNRTLEGSIPITETVAPISRTALQVARSYTSTLGTVKEYTNTPGIEPVLDESSTFASHILENCDVEGLHRVCVDVPGGLAIITLGGDTTSQHEVIKIPLSRYVDTDIVFNPRSNTLLARTQDGKLHIISINQDDANFITLGDQMNKMEDKGLRSFNDGFLAYSDYSLLRIFEDETGATNAVRFSTPVRDGEKDVILNLTEQDDGSFMLFMREYISYSLGYRYVQYSAQFNEDGSLATTKIRELPKSSQYGQYSYPNEQMYETSRFAGETMSAYEENSGRLLLLDTSTGEIRTYSLYRGGVVQDSSSGLDTQSPDDTTISPFNGGKHLVFLDETGEPVQIALTSSDYGDPRMCDTDGDCEEIDITEMNHVHALIEGNTEGSFLILKRGGMPDNTPGSSGYKPVLLTVGEPEENTATSVWLPMVLN